jgi:CBS domain-containing protein
VLKAAFQDVVVRDIMTAREDLDTVSESTSVAELMSRMFQERHTGYPVIRDGRLVGMVTLDDARGVREVERDAFTVDDVMTREITGIEPDADAMEAMVLMQQLGVGRLPVLDENDELVGLISRSDLVTAFNIIQSRGSLSEIPPREPSLDTR